MHDDLHGRAGTVRAATYIPATPCLRGHFKRYLKNGNCFECERDRIRLPRPPAPPGAIYTPKRPCFRGHTRRYASNGNCVDCTKARKRTWKPRPKGPPRKQAPTYHGKPCQKLHTLRYRSNDHCVECSKARKQSYTKEQRRAYIQQWRRTRRLLGLP